MKSSESDKPPTHDDLIKDLLSQARLLPEFFRAFVPEVLGFADFSAAEYLDKEHPRSGKRPRRSGDLLVKVKWQDRDTAFLIHIESQNRPETHALARIGEYALRDAIRYHMPVMPVLLLTYPKPETRQPGSLSWKFGKAAGIQVKCPELHFRRMDPRPHLESANVAALALTALMKLRPEQQVDAIVSTLAEALRQRLTPAELDAASAFVRHYTPLEGEQLLQLERRVRMLSLEEPALAPMPQLLNPFVELGKLKGLEEGRSEGELAFALRLLERKFPGLAKTAEPKLRRLPEEKLLAFGEALLFFETEAECRRWLRDA